MSDHNSSSNSSRDGLSTMNNYTRIISHHNSTNANSRNKANSISSSSNHRIPRFNNKRSQTQPLSTKAATQTRDRQQTSSLLCDQ